MAVTENVDTVVRAVHEAGGEVFFVGGAVRDSFMHLPSKDMDLLVRLLSVERLMEVLPGRVDAVGKSFGVLKVTVNGETIDVALPRTERSTGTGHGDFAVHSDPFLPVEQDLARRDFTMNAIAINAVTAQVVDPFNGMRAIAERRVEAVGNATERFTEDPLRMFRAIRFAARLGFFMSEEVSAGIETCAPLAATVAKERIAEEVSRTLMSDNGEQVRGAILRMRRFGIMEYVIPEWAASVGFKQHNPHHFLNVEGHVLCALEYAVNRGASLRARWAVLLHDIAKPATFTMGENGHGHFYGHEDVGEKMASEILHRLKFSEDFCRGVSKIVREHLRPQQGSSDRVLRRYVAAMGELTEDGLMCREADNFAHVGGGTAREVMDEFRSRIATMNSISGFTEAKLALRGDVIAAEMGVSGRAIGELKKAAAAAVVDGTVENEPNALMAFLKEFHAASNA
jgi:tRNA nucleotidyltransferase/poly(A) polymerase